MRRYWRWVPSVFVDRTGSSPCLELEAPDGRRYATVWPNGTWHTWDRFGVGGENAEEPSVRLACEQVVLALHRQALAHQELFRSPMSGMPAMPLEVPQ